MFRPLQTAAPPWWARIGDLFERARDGIGVRDGSLRIVAWNRAAAALTGAPGPEILGSRCSLGGNVLTVDLDDRRSAREVGTPSSGCADVRVCALQIRTRGGRLTVPNVVALLIPLCLGEGHAIVHLSPGPARRTGVVPIVDGLPEPLTDREREILVLLAAGKTAKPIAAQLALSLPTVRTHIRHILRKLRVHSCLEAAVWYLRDCAMAAAGCEAAAPPEPAPPAPSARLI